MNAVQTSSASLRDFLYLIFKRKSQLLVFFLATVLTVSVGTYLTTPTYETESQILVKIGRENLYMPTGSASTNAPPVISLNREEQINSEIQILMSRALLMKVAEAMGPAVIYDDIGGAPGWSERIKGIFGSDKKEKLPLSPLLGAVERLQKDLTVEAVKKSNVIDIKLKHKDPHMAATVLNKIVDLHMDHHLEVYKSPQSYKFFQDQSQILLGKLKAAENRLETFQKQHNVSSLEEERKLLLAQEGALRADLYRTQSQIAETGNRLTEIQRQLASTPKTIPTDQEVEHSPHVINTLQARLMELELKEKEYLAKYTEESRWVRNVREEIRVVRQKLTEQEEKRFGRTRSGLNTTYQRTEEDLYRNQAELKALKAKEEAQSSQVAVYRERLEKLNRIEVELKGLQRQVDVDQQTYRLYLTKFEESRISEAMDTEKMTNVTQIEPATPPLKPVKPKVMVNMILGVLLGIFGGLGLAFFTEYLDDSIRRPEDVESLLDLPVLTCIPELKALAGEHRVDTKKVKPENIFKGTRGLVFKPLPRMKPVTVSITPTSLFSFITSHLWLILGSGLSLSMGAFFVLWLFFSNFLFGPKEIESAAQYMNRVTGVIVQPEQRQSSFAFAALESKTPTDLSNSMIRADLAEETLKENLRRDAGSSQTAEVLPKASVPISVEELKPLGHPKAEVAQPKPTHRVANDVMTLAVQVGAFKSQTVAQELAATLHQKGYESKINEALLDENETLYRVQVVCSDSRKEANLTRDRLKTDGFDGFIVR